MGLISLCIYIVVGAILCCTIIDRLQGDQITASHEQLEEWQQRPQQIVARYIRAKLGISSAPDK